MCDHAPNEIPTFRPARVAEPAAKQNSDRQRILTVKTGDQTDFWRETFYGFVRDDGHFGFTEVTGDFSAAVSFAGDYTELYDQAGMMIRLNAETWLKAGIEYTDGQQHLSVVVTRGVSDWSVLPLTAPPAEIKLRLTRLGECGAGTNVVRRRGKLHDAAARRTDRRRASAGRGDVLLAETFRLSGEVSGARGRPPSRH